MVCSYIGEKYIDEKECNYYLNIYCDLLIIINNKKTKELNYYLNVLMLLIFLSWSIERSLSVNIYYNGKIYSGYLLQKIICVNVLCITKGTCVTILCTHTIRYIIRCQ